MVRKWAVQVPRVASSLASCTYACSDNLSNSRTCWIALSVPCLYSRSEQVGFWHFGGVSITCSTQKHAQLAPPIYYDWSDGSTERIGYLLRQSEVMEMVAGYPSRSKTACFQGQRSAHAVQWCTDCCSGAVSGPALSPGSLGSAQAFQNPTGMLWCSAVTVTRSQCQLKKRDKTPRSQPWVGSKKCTRVEFKVTVCCLMTPIRMLVYSESL